MSSFAALMPYLPAFLIGARATMEYGANMESAGVYRQMGETAATAQEFQAEQATVNAGQARAAAQREQAEQLRQSRLLQSRAVALAAASGGGVSDPSIVNLMGQIAGEGAYRGMVALYKGEEQARALRMEAAARRYDAAAARRGGEIRGAAYESAAVGSLLKGGMSLFEKYGRSDQPKAAAVEWTSGQDLPSGDTSIQHWEI